MAHRLSPPSLSASTSPTSSTFSVFLFPMWGCWGGGTTGGLRWGPSVANSRHLRLCDSSSVSVSGLAAPPPEPPPTSAAPPGLHEGRLWGTIQPCHHKDQVLRTDQGWSRRVFKSQM